MVYKQNFFAQVFIMDSNLRFLPSVPLPCDDAEHAIRRAKYRREQAHGVIAFSMMVDVRNGYEEEPEILYVDGAVPSEIRETIFTNSGVTDYARPRACNQ